MNTLTRLEQGRNPASASKTTRHRRNDAAGREAQRIAGVVVEPLRLVARRPGSRTADGAPGRARPGPGTDARIGMRCSLLVFAEPGYPPRAWRSRLHSWR